MIDLEGTSRAQEITVSLVVSLLLRNPDVTAASQMIVLGEQNGVRYQLAPDALAEYVRLYRRHHGRKLMEDSSEFLENYRRIVRLLNQDKLN
jgi:hypothetical protein